MKNLINILFLACLLFASCKATRQAQSVDLKSKSSKFLFKKLTQNQINATWLGAKAKITFRDQYGVQKFTANIRLRKDSLIWMNFKKVSVEAARIQITPDSIYIIDRLNNQFAIEGFDYLQRNFHLSTGFTGLQALLLGNPVFFTKDLDATIEETRYQLSGKTDHYETYYWQEPEAYLLEEMRVEDFRNNRVINVKLKDYQSLTDGQNFSYFRHLELSSREFGEVSIKIELSKLELNIPKTIRFEIPDRYTRMERQK